MRLINRRPDRTTALILAALPFLFVLLLYAAGSQIRKADNPDDKLLPSASQIARSVAELSSVPEERSGKVLLWSDTAESLVRLGLGVAIAAGLALGFGIAVGLIPAAQAMLAPAVAALSLVPPLAVLPILFIVFGLGEVAKVVLIVFGIAPFLIRDLSQHVAQLPPEQLIKAQTLGASTWQIILRVVLPQALPRLILGLRLALGPAWLFLIAAEAIAATGGLGYRIFLVRRYLAMDVILPYAVWITALAFVLDMGLRLLSRRAFAWAHAQGETL